MSWNHPSVKITKEQCTWKEIKDRVGGDSARKGCGGGLYSYAKHIRKKILTGGFYRGEEE